MVNINGETCDTWSEKAEVHSQPYTSGSRNAGIQGKSIRNQQERVDRTDSAELSCFDSRREINDSRAATSGGTVTQLIQDTERQVAEFESHTLQLRHHLQKLYTLRDQLGESE